MATSPKDRMHRLGQPSLFRRLAIAAVGVIVVLAVFMAVYTGEEPGSEEAGMEDTGAVEQADSAVDGQGAEPEGIGGEADPGVFADAPTPLEDGSSPNATSATQGDEMLDLPPNPPGGGRADPGEDAALAGEIAEEDAVPEHVRESDVRTALPGEETGAAEGGDDATENESADATTENAAAGSDASGEAPESDGAEEAGRTGADGSGSDGADGADGRAEQDQ